jgi:hypothetical protein
MSADPEKRKSPCCLAAHTGWDSLKNLKFQYALLRKLQAPFGSIFWFIQSRANRIQDEIERIQSNAFTEELP